MCSFFVVVSFVEFHKFTEKENHINFSFLICPFPYIYKKLLFAGFMIA